MCQCLQQLWRGGLEECLPAKKRWLPNILGAELGEEESRGLVQAWCPRKRVELLRKEHVRLTLNDNDDTLSSFIDVDAMFLLFGDRILT